MSLKARTEKRLMEKYNWFKMKNNDEKDENNEELHDHMGDEKKLKWGHYNKKKPPIEALEDENLAIVNNPPKAVLFVQYTANSELATEVKKMVQSLRPWTNLNLKVVERGGHKLQDILCKSNPWSSVACGRSDCFTCDSSIRGENPNFKSCYQRSIVYETWCNTCVKNHGKKCDYTDEDQDIYVGE